MVKRIAPWDLSVAAGLFIAGTAAVALTCDMGFVRDEAFYFAHSETYQDWFTELGKGEKERAAAVSRDAIAKTWRNNAEHPPLSKMLMGASWRLFGRKLREIGSFSVGDGGVVATISGLGPSHGFEKGSPVVLLSPQLVGESPSIEDRQLAAGTVTSRDRWHAGVRFHAPDGSKALLARLKTVCTPAGPQLNPLGKQPPPKIQRTGCEGFEARRWYVLSESDAMRFPGAVFAGLIVMLIFLAARGWFVSPAASRPLPMPFAILAGASYLLLPRPFYHAHLACFDMAICTLMMLCTVAYARSLRSGAWVFVVAVVWGLSLLAKHNAAVLPIAFIMHWLWDGLAEGEIQLTLTEGWRRWASLVAAALLLAVGWLAHPVLGIALAIIALASSRTTLSLPALPLAWFAMLPIGLLLLVAGWPLLWHDTLDHFVRWLEFHLTHEHYMQQYFGDVLAYPPFPVDLPWVLTALTWPVALLLACFFGTFAVVATGARQQWWRFVQVIRAMRGKAKAARREERPGDREWRGWLRLVLLSSIWPTVLIAMPSTPVFGGIKHWMPAYPFMLILAAMGLNTVWRTLVVGLAVPRPAAIGCAWLLAVVVAAPGAQATWEIHPHGTAYYNELIGGLPGAAEAGMQRQFWGGATRSGLQTVNERAPRSARVWFHNAAYGAFMMYQREGWFRRDFSYGHAPAGTTHGFYHHQKDHDDYELEVMADYGVKAPVMRASVDGVPILSVYERPVAGGSAGPYTPRPLERQMDRRTATR